MLIRHWHERNMRRNMNGTMSGGRYWFKIPCKLRGTNRTRRVFQLIFSGKLRFPILRFWQRRAAKRGRLWIRRNRWRGHRCRELRILRVCWNTGVYEGRGFKRIWATETGEHTHFRKSLSKSVCVVPKGLRCLLDRDIILRWESGRQFRHRCAYTWRQREVWSEASRAVSILWTKVFEGVWFW